MIEMRDICKSYPMGDTSVPVLRDISFTIGRGEFVVLTGKSGSGKSTLMHILGCLDSPTSGEYVLDGLPVAGLDDSARSYVRNRQIGFVFQGFHLMNDATALENLVHPLLYRRMHHSERKEQAYRALERVGLADRANFLPSQLSGGQRQRVAIARAICSGPSILLADEPTGNLDSENAAQVMDLFDTLHAEGNTIVLVTHDAETAARAHRTLSIRDGKIFTD